MFQINQKNKKYLFLGIAMLLLIIFFIKDDNTNTKMNCCGQEESISNIANEITNSESPIMYNYNTNWCGYSQQFQPIWNEFSDRMKNKKINGKKVICKDIKCENKENKEICKGVPGYPSVRLVINNNSIDYDGDRSVDALENFCKKYL
jgi:thiol-disulfide isomerase/thioredoxin